MKIVKVDNCVECPLRRYPSWCQITRDIVNIEIPDNCPLEDYKTIEELKEEIKIFKNRISNGVKISCELERRYVKLEEENKELKSRIK